MKERKRDFKKGCEARRRARNAAPKAGAVRKIEDKRDAAEEQAAEDWTREYYEERDRESYTEESQ